jgi:CMP-N,N'-diacetyllegionaminic acid synthase
MNLLVTICARGGSKGIPGKNIREIDGLPLIAYSTRSADGICQRLGGDIALSTDDERIRQVAARYGLPTTYTRPGHLATDTAGKIDTLADLLEYEEVRRKKKYDYILDLDVTSPFRTTDDLLQAMEQLQANKEALNIFSVSKARRNPYFNMVERNGDGFFSLSKRPENGLLTRQSAPDVFEMNASFYIYKRKFFSDRLRSAITDRSLAFVMPHLCFDLDHEDDFEFMEFLLKNDKLDFTL